MSHPGIHHTKRFHNGAAFGTLVVVLLLHLSSSLDNSEVVNNAGGGGSGSGRGSGGSGQQRRHSMAAVAGAFDGRGSV